MDRIVLEKAWLDSFGFNNLSVEESVKKLSELSSKRLAAETYQAAMELREEGINWYGSNFEDELVEIVKKGDLKITNADVHISVDEYKEILKLRKGLNDKGLDEVIADATDRVVETANANCEKETEL